MKSGVSVEPAVSACLIASVAAQDGMSTAGNE